MTSIRGAIATIDRYVEMRAVKFSRYGGPDVLDIVEVEPPPAEADTVVVATVAAATNPGEIGIREGRFADIRPAHFPEGQGNDFAGYVAEIGSNITDFAVGDEVLGFAPRAAQAEFVEVGSDSLTVKPAGLEWEAAATVAGAVPQPGRRLRR